MRVLVCGGRDFDDWGKLDKKLDELLHSKGYYYAFTIIEGGAKGADFLARVWAKYMDIPFEEYPADWNKHGKAAGGIRNQQMLDEGKPDLVVAFAGGAGTADMVRRAKKAGVEVEEVT